MSLALASVKEIALLAKSPAFAMSLGAKELFHTNFLAFLLETEDPALVDMQLAIRAALGFPCSQGAVSQCAVWREKNSLDLLVVELRPAPDAAQEPAPAFAQKQRGRKAVEQVVGAWDWTPGKQWETTADPVNGEVGDDGGRVSRFVHTGNVLIVEAKLKSVPQRSQLDEYDRKLAHRSILLEYPVDADPPEWRLAVGGAGQAVVARTLLSVAGASMTTLDESNAVRHVWAGVSWKKLHEAMAASIDTLDDSPLQGIVTDYIRVLGALVELLDRVHRLCDDARSAPGKTPAYGAVRRQPLHPMFRALRISDLLGKTLFDAWRHALMAGRVLPDLPDGWSRNTYVNYSRGVPGLGIELVNPGFMTPAHGPVGLKIGVQIQSCEFRLFIDVDRDWKGLEGWIGAHPVLLADWFRTPVFATTPVGVNGAQVMALTGNGRATSLKKFGINRFLYSKVDIDHCSIADVEAELWRVIAKAETLLASLHDGN